MNKSQTALEWLINKIANQPHKGYFTINGLNVTEAINKAREMEKIQHGKTWDAAIQAHEDRGHVLARSICDFDDYFEETYANDKVTD